ncbi:dihydroxyacetone kinase subunit DhaK [Salibacterium halotolerans]|uniref:Dihydroxyacetone kinase, N-terminal domain n=1 Tax=Salibacterium halotolerans TaxID=1884432 RepID=A0A1I5PM24_9BACI|nr:dihydroxyacetone kinase subunit DhaK [Salibacterium halotolerans]SFP35085.1 dihydroxyacetone kinase, N-terminal domain [Salibacterium halotolerans]
MKKLINDPDSVVEEMISGYLKAHSSIVNGLDANPRSIIKTNAGSKDKVSVIIGGGSGHEPAFMGYVGAGMADGAAVGNIFSSPPPDPVVEAAKASHTGSGVLLIYGNYQGDVMNFGMAVDILEMDEDIEAREVVVKDDIASASKEEAEKRRGIAGEFFVTKTAGAAAEQGYSFDDVQRLTEKANRNVASMGVGLSPCSLPQTGKPSFVLADDEMEIGLGHHGEPGVERDKLTTSQHVTERILNDIIIDMGLKQKEEVSVLINGLGSTTRMELYIMYDKVESLLKEKGITIYKSYVGDYSTSMEMGGCSISLLRMDDELKPLIDAPAKCPMYTQS